MKATGVNAMQTAAVRKNNSAAKESARAIARFALASSLKQKQLRIDSITAPNAKHTSAIQRAFLHGPGNRARKCGRQKKATMLWKTKKCIEKQWNMFEVFRFVSTHIDANKLKIPARTISTWCGLRSRKISVIVKKCQALDHGVDEMKAGPRTRTATIQ